MNEKSLPDTASARWSRLLHTPLSELFGGKSHRPRSVGAVLKAAALPAPLAELTRAVARRTRLWRGERADVAGEVAGHFRDGLVAGRTADELAKSFGDVEQAARLIRRAKLQARPLFWRAWRRGLQAAAAVVALTVAWLALAALRLVLHHPTVAHNYRLDIVASTLGVPEADRAWPFYQKALLGLTPIPETPDGKKWADEERPGDKGWPLAEKWLDENQSALVLAREGAERARLGFVFEDPANKDWEVALGWDPKLYDPAQNDLLMEMLLPQFQELGKLMRLLQADGRRALAAGNQAEFIADVTALVGIAEQFSDDLPLFVVDFNAFRAFEMGLELVDEALAARPDLLTDDDLRQLAHRIAGYGQGGAVTLHVAGEQAMFHDMLQRMYSDDGNGNGVLTREGLEQVNDLLELAGKLSVGGHAQQEDEFLVAVRTIRAALEAPSRRELTDTGDALFDLTEAESHLPLWESRPQKSNKQIRLWNDDPVDRRRYAPLTISLLPDTYPHLAAERITQERDATLVALAVTLYHRQHEAWPERLGELVPDLLPAVPRDRFTGGPIGYRLVDGRPIIYVVGSDQTDEGGKPGRDGKFAKLGQDMVRFVDASGEEPAELTGAGPAGDVVLWPPTDRANPAGANKAIQQQVLWAKR